MEKTKSIKGFIVGIKNWIKKNPKEFWVLLVILIVGAFLRLYKIGEYMTFLGDEGRDAIIVRRLLVYGDPILVGPGTSIGNMYLGPLYYYMMAPALFAANLSPVGPAIQIALLGVITIGIVWWMGREWFGKWVGLASAIFYAISPTIITYSRSSWNPNIMPFFALVSIWAIWSVWKKSVFGWLLVLGGSFAFILQSHYLGLLLAPPLLIFWLLSFKNVWNKSELRKSFIRHSLLGLTIFVFLMSPLVIFDARHNWINFSAMKKFFGERQTTVSARPWNALPKMYPRLEKINTRLLGGMNEKAGKYVTVGLIAGLIFLLRRNKKRIFSFPYLLLFSWLGFALLGLGLYKQEIYDHYYGFLFAAPILLGAAAFKDVMSLTKSKAIKAAILGFALYLLFVNLSNSPLLDPPQMQMQRARAVSEKISLESGGEPFNLAVIAERNYEDGYQYFLEREKLPVIDIDAQRPETVTQQLFVVCELPREKCDPTHNPKTEIANFGWSKIEAEWEVMGHMVYKLKHSI